MEKKKEICCEVLMYPDEKKGYVNCNRIGEVGSLFNLCNPKLATKLYRSDDVESIKKHLSEYQFTLQDGTIYNDFNSYLNLDPEDDKQLEQLNELFDKNFYYIKNEHSNLIASNLKDTDEYCKFPSNKLDVEQWKQFVLFFRKAMLFRELKVSHKGKTYFLKDLYEIYDLFFNEKFLNFLKNIYNEIPKYFDCKIGYEIDNLDNEINKYFTYNDYLKSKIPESEKVKVKYEFQFQLAEYLKNNFNLIFNLEEQKYISFLCLKYLQREIKNKYYFYKDKKMKNTFYNNLFLENDFKEFVLQWPETIIFLYGPSISILIEYLDGNLYNQGAFLTIIAHELWHTILFPYTLPNTMFKNTLLQCCKINFKNYLLVPKRTGTNINNITYTFNSMDIIDELGAAIFQLVAIDYFISHFMNNEPLQKKYACIVKTVNVFCLQNIYTLKFSNYVADLHPEHQLSADFYISSDIVYDIVIRYQNMLAGKKHIRENIFGKEGGSLYYYKKKYYKYIDKISKLSSP